jgi:dipeptidyl aminopeptidase/acylaminoacyl peptidase
LAFRSQGDVAGKPHWIHVNTLFVAKLGGRAHPIGDPRILSDSRPVAWLRRHSLGLLVERKGQLMWVERTGVTLASNPEDYLSGCTPDSAGIMMSCVRQSLSHPPEVALVDPATKQVRTLTHVNPAYDCLQRGEVSELHWSNQYGNQTDGYLIRPVGYVPGRRYPFLVILYGFERQFISQAQWITSFPAQVFAARGFAVLLMNPPPSRPFRWQGNQAAASFFDSENPVASIEAAVDTLVAIGIADRTRGGIMGWSLGSYWTDLTISRSDAFRAASSGETGWRTAGSYWLGNDQSRYVLRAFFGGPPAGLWSQAYAHSSPVLRPAPHVPVLREYELRSLHGLEYLSWADQGAEVELVFYPDDAHVFEQPVHRLASMQRNLDWFAFWLLNTERIDPATHAQYERWRAMRERVEANRATLGVADR